MDSGKHLLRPGYVPECDTGLTIVRNTPENPAQDVAIHGSQRAPVGFLRIDDVGSAGERGEDRDFQRITCRGFTRCGAHLQIQRGLRLLCARVYFVM